MRPFLLCFIPAAALLSQGPFVRAGKIALPLEHLQSSSQMIVTGKVESVHVEKKTQTDGSKKAIVVLKVVVDTVAKGDASPGQTMEVRCWRVVKPPQLPRNSPMTWDYGSDFIPGQGSRAKFFLERQSGGVWDAQWPNGIEGLGGAAPLDLPQEPPDPAPPDKESSEKAIRADTYWPYFLGVGIAAGVLLPVVVFAVWRRRKTVDPNIGE